jgi:hypothetical protein
MSIGMSRCQEGNERGARHLHTRNLAGRTAHEKPRACIVRFVHATFFTAETSTPPQAVVSGWIRLDQPERP